MPSNHTDNSENQCILNPNHSDKERLDEPEKANGAASKRDKPVPNSAITENEVGDEMREETIDEPAVPEENKDVEKKKKNVGKRRGHKRSYEEEETEDPKSSKTFTDTTLPEETKEYKKHKHEKEPKSQKLSRKIKSNKSTKERKPSKKKKKKGKRKESVVLENPLFEDEKENDVLMKGESSDDLDMLEKVQVM